MQKKCYWASVPIGERKGHAASGRAFKTGKGIQAKILMVMRLTAILLTTALLHAHAATRAQTVSLSGEKLLVKDVLMAIEKQTGYFVFFSDKHLLADSRPVTLSVRDMSLKDFLDIALKDQPFTYEIEDKTISLIRKAPLTLFYGKAGPPVTGRITGADGRPIPGATIMVKGTKTGATSSELGNFTLKDLPENAVLQISMMGYETMEIHISGNNAVTANKAQAALLDVVSGESIRLGITLMPSTSPLDEVQIVAYGKTARRLNIGAVSTIKSADIKNQPVTNPLLALQGRVPGVTVIQENGIPGAGVKIQIRGQNSLNKTQPLYVVNGVPVDPDIPGGPASLSYYNRFDDRTIKPSAFTFINPNDIESIDILKDADATSLYGSRGANGVILITTKTGKAGRTNTDVYFSQGFANVPKKLDVLDRRQYLDMRYEALHNDNATIGQIPAFDVDLLQWDTSRSTDWQKTLMGKTAYVTNAYASISGGAETVQYLIAGGYQKQTSVFPGNFADTKANIKFSLSGSSTNKKLNIQLGAGFMTDKNIQSNRDFTEGAIRLSPVAPKLYHEDGTLNWESSTWANPLADVMRPYNFRNNNLISNLSLSYTFSPAFVFQVNAGYNNTMGNNFTSYPFTAMNPATRQNSDRSAEYERTAARSWTVDPQLHFTHDISKGRLKVYLGANLQGSSQERLWTKGVGYETDEALQNLNAAQQYYSGIDQNTQYKYNGAYTRIEYNWQDRYELSLNARRDGSSRFGPGNQFGNFGSIGAAWIISNESFLRDHTLISFAKLRGSFGSSGNDNISDYAYLQKFEFTAGTYGGVKGLNTTGLYDSYYHWEITRKLGTGLEVAFLKDRIFFTVDYYRDRSGNQLRPAPIPSYAGPGSITINRNALIQNSGFEFSVNAQIIRQKQLTWTTGFNISLNRNKLLKYDNLAGSADDFLFDIGESFSRQRIFRLAGVDPQNGRYQFYDREGKLTYTPNGSTDALSDRTKYINTDPRFFGGLQSTIAYKGCTLDFLFQFTKQLGRNYLFNTNVNPGSFFGGNQPATVLDRWQKPGDAAAIQRFNQNLELLGASIDALNSDLSFSDASYIRLKNISLSCDFPEAWRRRMHMRMLQLTLQGQNVLTFTNYKGLDPETLNASSLPPLRTITAGIRVGL